MTLFSLAPDHLAAVLDHLPVGVTVIDTDARILYYNAFCTRYVDRKPEYIGHRIHDCHTKPESLEKIGTILADLASGAITEYHYQARRNGVELTVTFVPLRLEGKLAGFIQSFTVGK